jgi:predicted CxxxxCH...CXXCH cytochrome family protein
MRCSYYYWLGLEVQSGNGGAGQFCMFSSESVRRFDTVEVWGSSPHGPTMCATCHVVKADNGCKRGEGRRTHGKYSIRCADNP